MKSKNLLMLFVMAMILMVVAVWMTREKQRTEKPETGGLLMPDFPINDIEKLVISSGSNMAVVARVDGAWVAPERYNYPVRYDKLRDMLVKLPEIKIGEKRSLTESQRKEVKLAVPGSPGAGSDTGTYVQFFAKDNRNLGSLLVGAERQRPGGAPRSPWNFMPGGWFVSTDDGKTACLVNESLGDFNANLHSWMNDEIVSVQCFGITNITIAHQNKKQSFYIYKKGEDYQMDGLSRKQELDSTKVQNARYALSLLNFEDVANPALTDEQTGLDKPVIYTAVTDQDEIYTACVGGFLKDSRSRYMRLTAALLPAKEQADAKKTETDAAGKDIKTADKDKGKDARKEKEEKIKKINERVGKWVYIISELKALGLSFTKDEMIKEGSAKEQTVKEKSTKDSTAEPKQSWLKRFFSGF